MTEEEKKRLEEEERRQAAKGSIDQQRLNYEAAFLQSLRLRAEFAQKENYVREKGAEEMAYHQAKKAFGEFTPRDRGAMESNTNNGKGYVVELPNGGQHKLNNQAELYDKVRDFNKKNGSFYDEKYIRENSPQDYEKLRSVNKNLKDNRDALIDGVGERSSGMAIVKDIERRVKADFDEKRKPKQSNDREQDGGYDRRSQDGDLAQGKTGSGHERKGVSTGKENTTGDKEIFVKKKGPGKESDEIPHELNNKYVVKDVGNGDQYYYREQPGTEAFRDKGNSLITRSTATTVARSMVALAEAKQWQKIGLKGTEQFKRTVWMEAKLRGLEVEGYTPTKQDLQNLAAHQKDENGIQGLESQDNSQSSSQDNSQSSSQDNSRSSSRSTSSRETSVDRSIPERRRKVWRSEEYVVPNATREKSKADKALDEIGKRLLSEEQDSRIQTSATFGEVFDGEKKVVKQPEAVAESADEKLAAIAERVRQEDLLSRKQTAVEGSGKVVEIEQEKVNEKPKTADEKLAEVGRKIHEKEKAAGQDGEVNNSKVVNIKERFVDKGQRAENSLEQDLKAAFKDMPKDKAVNKYPGLEPIYQLAKAAKQFVNHSSNEGKFSEQGKERFINGVTERAFGILAKGGEIPALQSKTANENSKNQELER